MWYSKAKEKYYRLKPDAGPKTRKKKELKIIRVLDLAGMIL